MSVLDVVSKTSQTQERFRRREEGMRTLSQQMAVSKALTVWFGLWSVLVSLSQCSVKYIHWKNSIPKDSSIQSDNYPGVYPINSNVTWVFETTYGQWGVFFRDFALSHDEDFTDWGDLIRLQSDRNGPIVTYTYSSDPRPYISKGSTLIISFLSDSIKDDASVRGFDLDILFGNTESDVRLKLHEAAKRKSKKNDDRDNDSLPVILIVTLTILALAALCAAVVCALKLKSAKKVKADDGRDVFGVRRGSGVRHTRHSSSTSPPQSPDQTDAPRVLTGRQGQNGHFGWMARAERSNSLNSSRRNRNAASSGHAAHASPGPIQHSHQYSNNSATDPDTPMVQGTASNEIVGAPPGTNFKEVQQVFECVLDHVGQCRDTSHSFRFISDIDKKASRSARDESSGHASGKHANTYVSPLKRRENEETAKKASFRQEQTELEDYDDDICPPSYDSLLEGAVSETNVNIGCYGNVVDAQCYLNNEMLPNHTSSGKYFTERTEPETEGSYPRCHSSAWTTSGYPAVYVHQLPEFIVTDHSHSPLSSRRDPLSLGASPAKHDLHPEDGKVCFVDGDGYAYIIPRRPEENDPQGKHHPQHEPLPLSSTRYGTGPLSVVPDRTRVSQLANDLGYIDMMTETSPRAHSLENMYPSGQQDCYENIAVTE
ncbi:hypothetical protein Bpfe_015544 [Biomphalaria pfeifferi]|uniref:CUB domain-containing protein n=1 Tax=Biomphalaria pfeifferi TaxID=112525 RepID=A0AAD8BJ44_BIOPF|nr:hypothetical protein Bpfe_015544 [Biomphalaria pfeifferi]